MKLKALLILVGVVLVSFVALGVFLLLFFDPNDYKTQIEAKLEEKTSRKITITGEMDLSVFPWLGIEVGEVSMANAPGFGSEPFASVKAAEISVSLLPLLRKEIQMGSVMLDGLMLRLQKNAVGQNNWDDIGEKKTPEEEEEDKDSEIKLDSLEVAALEIKNASVLWDDTQKGSRYQLNDFNFTTGRLRSGDPFLVESDFILVSGKPPVSRKVALDTEVTADLEKKTYRLKDFVLKSGPGGQTAPEGEPPLALRGEVDMDLADQTLSIANLVVESAGLKITGHVQGSRIRDEPRFKGQIKSNDINPREVMKGLGKDDPNTTDSSVLKKANFEASFEATPDRADLRPISIQLDDSRMNGSVSIANFSDAAYGFDLVVDQLDLDRYLSPPEKKAGGATTGAGAGDGSKEEGEVSVDALKNLNLNGTLKIAKFKMRNLRFTDATLSLHAKDGIMALEPLTANFYQGRINMTSRVDANGARPAYSIKAQTNGIAVEPMLVDLNGQSKITGTGSVNLNVHTAGSNSGAIKRGLNGTMSFNLRDGEFKGFNLAQKIRNARAMYKGEPVDNDAPQSTPFSAISGEANIVNGVLRNDDLDGQSPAFKVSGNGTASLVSETIDYLARVAVLDPRRDAAGLEELKSLTIPVRVTGTFDNPQFKVDIAAALREVAKEKVREKIEEKREEAKDKLKEKLDEKLKDLFNRGSDDEASGEPAQQ